MEQIKENTAFEFKTESPKWQTAIFNLKLVWIPLIVAIVAMLIFAGTFGFLLRLEHLSNTVNAWETWVMFVLAIAYIIFSFYSISVSDHSGEPMLGLVAIGMALFMPVLSMLLCGAGASAPDVIAMILLRSNRPEIICSARDLTEFREINLVPQILWTYCALGVCLQITSWIISGIRKCFRRKKEPEAPFDKIDFPEQANDWTNNWKK